MAPHQTEPSIKKVRGLSVASIDLIEAMYDICKAAQPITGRGIGYKLFALGLIESMDRSNMQKVYRTLLNARERGDIPWDWVVDETRQIERVATWSDPAEYARIEAHIYRRDFWDQQPVRVEVWSEKGTVRGVLAPTLDEYAVGFNVMHGFGSATAIYGTAQSDNGRPLHVLYVGDWDPSGMCMSERDLPERFARYGGDHIRFKRIALTKDQLTGLPHFPAADKKTDQRYKWFVKNFGRRCWELDALDPRDLRARVKREIKKLIEPVAWARCMRINAAEQASLQNVLSAWARRS